MSDLYRMRDDRPYPMEAECEPLNPQADIAPLLAGISELADRYQVQANTVAVWTQRHDSFPEPLLQVGGRIRVWWVPDVDEWYNQRQR